MGTKVTTAENQNDDENLLNQNVDNAGVAGNVNEDDDDSDLVLMIGDTPAPDDESEEELNKAPAWVRELRKNHRDVVKRNRELELKLAEKEPSTAAPAAKQLRPKPKVEDFDFDPSKFEEDLDKWYAEKSAAEKEKDRIESAKRSQEAEWTNTLAQYSESKTKLKFADVEEIESIAFSLLDVTQQGIIIQGCDNPALVMYAIGKDSAEAKKLSSIKDPVKFATVIGKFEEKLRMAKRGAIPPAPEKMVASKGGAPKSGSVDSTLERLEAEADKSGDRSKVIAYKRQLKQKAN